MECVSHYHLSSTVSADDLSIAVLFLDPTEEHAFLRRSTTFFDRVAERATTAETGYNGL